MARPTIRKPSIIRDIIARYDGGKGETTRQIAARYGVQPPAITKLLNSEGVPVVRRKATSRAERIAKLCSQGMSELEARRIILPSYHLGTVVAARVAEKASRQAQLDAEADANRQDREPCRTCGVRADRHAEHGCRKWR